MIGICLVWASLAVSVSGPPQPAIEQVTIGVAGLYKVGHWTPVEITLTGAARPWNGRVRLRVTDGNGVPSVYEDTPCELPAGQSTRRVIYARFGQLDNGLSVEFLADEGVRVERYFAAHELPNALRTNQRVVLSLGPEVGVDAALQLRPGWLAGRVVHGHVRHVTQLPDHWLGYGGVDAVIVSTSDFELPQDSEARRWQALVRWVQLGGTVVVSASARADRFVAADFAGSSLLPGPFERVASQRETTGMEQFAGATQRLDQTLATAVEFSAPMAVLREPRGVVEVYEGLGTARLPAVIRHGVGLGRATFVAFDLDQRPFRTWPDRPRLVARLLDQALGQQESASAPGSLEAGQGAQTVTDLVSQLRVALDRFARVRLVPFALMAGLITGYIILVGPLDYWWLRRRRRLEWTWLTFPLIVVLFVGLAATLALAWKGRSLQVHQAEIVDLDLDSGTVRGTVWSHIFSPRTARWDVDLAVQPPLPSDGAPQRVISWEGAPGEGLGALDSGFQSSAFADPYAVRGAWLGPDRAHVWLEGFPFAVWSSRGLVSRWWGRAADAATERGALVEDAEHQLVGTLRSPLSCDLTAAYLLYDRWVYSLGTVTARQTVALADQSALDLRSWLTQRRVLNGRNVTAPWDWQHTDVDRILQLVMFYDAANGRNYTQLLHDYQRWLDMSDQLKLRRAILVGRMTASATQLTLDGRPVSAAERAESSYCRVLYPVQAQK